MDDLGHSWTDRQIAELERRIAEIFEEAARDVEGKMDRFLARFAKADARYQELMDQGKITKVDYADWLRGQVFQHKRWQAQLEDLAKTMNDANRIAADMINAAAPDVYAYNANWAAYTLEKQMDARGYDMSAVPRPKGAPLDTDAARTGRTAGVVRYGFGLYDADTVMRLIRDDPKLLPPSRVDIPKDMRWNMQKFNLQITQGIIQGESLEEVAARLRTVADMNLNQSRTHTQTAMGAAQNAGREDSYRRARSMGIDVGREWISTLDMYTRDTHRKLDGQIRPEGVPFEATDKRGRHYKIMYPCDPEAAPCMVYNCRCTTGGVLADSPPENAKRRDDDPERVPIRDMTYQEWLEYKRGMMGGS